MELDNVNKSSPFGDKSMPIIYKNKYGGALINKKL